jgi:excisionase family DNA binding protein
MQESPHDKAAPVMRPLTVADVAERLQVSGRTIQMLIGEGILKVPRIGGSVHITEQTLVTHLTGDEEK